MLRLFANAKYDFISVPAVRVRRHGCDPAAGLLLLLVRGSTTASSSPAAPWSRCADQDRWTSAALRTGARPRRVSTAPRSRTSAPPNELVIRARVAQAGDRRQRHPGDGERRAARRSIGVLGAGSYTVLRTEAVGPKVGGELRQKAFLAIFLSFFAVLAYLAYRFEWRFGLAAVIATAHDILATIAFIGVMRLEVSLYRRRRPCCRWWATRSTTPSSSSTASARTCTGTSRRPSRTSSTARSTRRCRAACSPHGTTLARCSRSRIFGGEVIRPFALVMFFGVFVGTFSSIFIASPVLMAIEQRWPGPAAALATRPPAPASTRKPQPAG